MTGPIIWPLMDDSILEFFTGRLINDEQPGPIPHGLPVE
jgi:hypothetical protein